VSKIHIHTVPYFFLYRAVGAKGSEGIFQHSKSRVSFCAARLCSLVLSKVDA
jgi:hypothetical protein